MAGAKKTRRAKSSETFHPPEELPPHGPARRRVQNRLAQQNSRARKRAAARKAHQGAELTEGTSHIEDPGDAANDGEGSVQSVSQCSSSQSIPLSSPSPNPAGHSIVNEHKPKQTDIAKLVIQQCLSTQGKLRLIPVHAKFSQPQLDFMYILDSGVCSDTPTLGQSSSQSDYPKDTGAKHVQQCEGLVEKLHKVDKRLDWVQQQKS